MIGIIYCQSLAVCYDPHTDYFSPDEKAEFETDLGNKSAVIRPQPAKRRR